jgi:hypothetical protein
MIAGNCNAEGPLTAQRQSLGAAKSIFNYELCERANLSSGRAVGDFKVATTSGRNEMTTPVPWLTILAGALP